MHSHLASLWLVAFGDKWKHHKYLSPRWDLLIGWMYVTKEAELYDMHERI